MIRIPLHRRDGSVADHALVDDEDAVLAELRWSLMPNGYARRNAGNGKWPTLHRVVANAHGDAQVDHINRNRLDNRRANLRILEGRYQQQNKSAHRNSSSAYRGVMRKPQGWVAQAHTAATGNLYLGTYRTEIDAAAAAAQHREEFMPYAVEDEALLAHKPRRVPSSERLGWHGATAVRLALASTSLSYRAIADMFGVHPGSVFAVTQGRTYRLEAAS